jgi:predicted site-specific integrase-resolvase
MAKIGTTTAAHLLGCHPATVLQQAKSGALKAEFTDTGRAIFERSAIEREAARRVTAQRDGDSAKK